MNRHSSSTISRKRSKAALTQMLVRMVPERRALLKREDLERSWNVPGREIDELLASIGQGILL
jgi:hypothetical protein